MSDSTLMHETYRPNAEFDGDAYTRSVHSFWCPICKAGRQRPNVTAVYFDDWRYECDHCRATGTKQQIENSAFYAERIPSKTCPICGDKQRVYAQRMSGDWWMSPTRKWIWRCEGCTFVGTLADFRDEADRQAAPMFEV